MRKEVTSSMKVVTPQEMATMDQNTICAGTSGLDLMEKAGFNCTKEIEKYYDQDKRILILCGTGNNGGDGFVIAHYLKSDGYPVSVFLLGDRNRMTEENQVNCQRALKEEIATSFLEENETIDCLIQKAADSHVIIDAVFGTGLRERPLSSWYCSIFQQINELSAAVVSIDIPSGLRGDNGLSAGQAIMASQTIVIQNIKTGLLLNDGPDYAGELICIDIGIKEDSIRNQKFLTQKSDLCFPEKRKKNSHKYDYGSILIIAGSKGMIGAGLLAIEGAINAGAGLVTSYVPQEVYIPVAARSPVEVMIKTYETNITGEDIAEDRKEVVLIGPGIGRKKNYSIILHDLLEDENLSVVIDADGIYHLRRLLDVLKTSKTPVVLTPHMGEFARLIDMDQKVIEQDPVKFGSDFAMEYGVTLVLKGYRTMVFNQNGEVWFNSTGNPGMATAGSGDVLAGIITGIAGQTKDLFKAARAGVYYHGAAGDTYAARFDETTLTARSLIESLKFVMKTGV